MNALLRFSGLPMVTGVLFIFAKNITGVGQGNLTISTIHARTHALMDQEMDMRNITAVNLNEEKKKDGQTKLQTEAMIDGFLERKHF